MAMAMAGTAGRWQCCFMSAYFMVGIVRYLLIYDRFLCVRAVFTTYTTPIEHQLQLLDRGHLTQEYRFCDGVFLFAIECRPPHIIWVYYEC